jgi:uncharacterized YigZ family protein
MARGASTDPHCARGGDGRGRPGREADLSAEFDTLAAAQRYELRVRRSLFIAVAWPASSEEQARARIEDLRREYPDASHHCWAYRVSTGTGESERSHDAGEPAGTAGVPILQAARSAALLNVVVAVARYFGGTKLGKGGLARAYRDAAAGALANAPRVRSVPRTILRATGPVARDGEIRHLVAHHGGRVLRADYGDGIEAALELEIPSASIAALSNDLDSATRGTWRLEKRA